MMKGVKGKQLCNTNHFRYQCIVTLTFNHKINRAHLNSWGVFVWSFMIIGCKEKQNCDINHFPLSMHCDLDHLTAKSIGHILDSLGVVVWSFMIISEKRKHLCAGIILPYYAIFGYQCIVTLTFDLLTQKSLEHILHSSGVCMRSFMMIGVKTKQFWDWTILPTVTMRLQMVI